MMWELESALRLLVATLVGAAVGLNRDLHGKPTGVRTLGLVGLASALLTLMVIDAGGGHDAISRVVQGVVTGIGFLGAGVILRDPAGQHVHGLTTAAAIWLTAALGMAVGYGLWWTVASAVVLTFAVLLFGGRLEKRLRAALKRETGDED
ncbi:MgtC/SapB family protein [Sandaracinobacteroides saxicola]|uniref:Protein MgtC n=1 Tax=Sandaracinobacteroides saxicola TaxID=2759707 RepID=A0A7G5IFZ1_9SPHN|nr:MgtC/SapB family protein [Sandaracinobacteroides saxicola]QMW22283.1 MgtC/SapB family protein [Sandaracinobacteroides saxicola]